MDYLVRLIQTHESFRRPELDALAELYGVEIQVLDYTQDSPYCILRFPSLVTTHPNSPPSTIAKRFISRAILSRAIFELWGTSSSGDYSTLHTSVNQISSHVWPKYKTASFAFDVDTYQSTLTSSQQLERINQFAYLGFDGPIDLKNPAERFVIFEEYDHLPTSTRIPVSPDRKPKRLFFGRWIGDSSRHLADMHDLKKRPYISTTSMDAELALVSANFALIAPGKLAYDPFVGTGGFLVSAAQFGALCWGSDIDGRSYRGKETKKKAKGSEKPDEGPPSRRGLDNGVGKNMIKYGTRHNLLDCFTSDLTNTPFRLPQHPDPSSSAPEPQHETGYLDAILTDPPYGVREGLKVLGRRGKPDEPLTTESTPVIHMINDVAAYTLPGYIAPKRPYSFERMLDDILDFAARTLVVGGRLVFWMPVAGSNEVNAEEIDESRGTNTEDTPESRAEKEDVIPVPQHPRLLLLTCCEQTFNKWSRRLLVYKKLAVGSGGGRNGSARAAEGGGKVEIKGRTADELNDFRRKYFEAFSSSRRTEPH